LQVIKTKKRKKKKIYDHNFPDTEYEILYKQNSNVSNMTNNGLTPKQNMNEMEELPTYYNEEEESEQSENTEISEEDSLSSPNHSDTPLMDDDEEPSQSNQTRESYTYSFDGNEVESEQIGTPKPMSPDTPEIIQRSKRRKKKSSKKRHKQKRKSIERYQANQNVPKYVFPFSSKSVPAENMPIINIRAGPALRARHSAKMPESMNRPPPQHQMNNNIYSQPQQPNIDNWINHQQPIHHHHTNSLQNNPYLDQQQLFFINQQQHNQQKQRQQIRQIQPIYTQPPPQQFNGKYHHKKLFHSDSMNNYVQTHSMQQMVPQNSDYSNNQQSQRNNRKKTKSHKVYGAPKGGRQFPQYSDVQGQRTRKYTK